MRFVLFVQREQVKREILMKALAEASDLEALREEKRQLALQEKRIKALMDLEKTNVCRVQFCCCCWFVGLF